MNIHLIIDFQHLYYRHKFSMERKFKPKNKLNTNILNSDTGVEENLDMGYIYYPLADIEKFRENFEKSVDGSKNNVTVSVCFDSKTERKDENVDYKASRCKRISDEDKEYIKRIEKIIGVVGYNIYKEEGKEADDLVTTLVNKFKNKFDFTVIFTNDNDLTVNIDSELKVGIMRHRSNKGYLPISISNLESTLSEEYELNRFPYNVIMLYKCTVGDKSDDIKGITGFGPKAFDKLIDEFEDTGNVDFSKMIDADYVKQVIEENSEIIGEDKITQALEALELVRFRECNVDEPVNIVSTESRRRAYEPYKMVSIIK